MFLPIRCRMQEFISATAVVLSFFASFSCSSFLHAQTTDGLIACYPFDEVTGPVIDCVGSFDGTNHGAIRGVEGRYGNAFQFDGFNSFVETLPADAIPTECTISLWMKPTHNARENHQVFGSVQNINTGEHGLVLNYYETDTFEPDGTTPHSYEEGVATTYYHDRGRILSPRHSFPLDTWTHLTYTCDSENIVKIYANGHLTASGEFTTAPSMHDRSLMFGKAVFSQDIGFDGKLDEVRIYNQALSASQVLELYQSHGLIAYYKFDEVTGPVIDCVGSFDGTNHGAIRGVEGRYGNAFQFDGFNSFVETLPADAIPTECTISLWMKPTHNARENHQVFGSVQNINTGEHGLVLNYYETDTFEPDGTTPHSYEEGVATTYYHDRGRILSPRHSFPLDTWTHLTYTCDSENIVKIYANGHLTASGEFTTAPSMHDRSLMFGKAVFSQDRGFDGKMDEVRIYNRALLESEVVELYHQSVVVPDSFLVTLGRLSSGGSTEISESDNQYLVLDPEFLSFRYQLEFGVDATSTTVAPIALEFNYESRAFNFVGTVEQKIELFNYELGIFETVDNRLASATDTVVSVTPSGDPARFVQAGTNAMHARISYENSLPFWVFSTQNLYLPYRVRADHIFWTISH